MYGGLAEATWGQSGEDRTCRCYTLSWNAQSVQFMFYKGSGYPHPDAVFVSTDGNVLLEPGKRHVFPESMYLVQEPCLKASARNPRAEVLDATGRVTLPTGVLPRRGWRSRGALV